MLHESVIYLCHFTNNSDICDIYFITVRATIPVHPDQCTYDELLDF